MTWHIRLQENAISDNTCSSQRFSKPWECAPARHSDTAHDIVFVAQPFVRRYTRVLGHGRPPRRTGAQQNSSHQAIRNSIRGSRCSTAQLHPHVPCPPMVLPLLPPHSTSSVSAATRFGW